MWNYTTYSVFFKLILETDILNISCEIGQRWVLYNLIDDN